MPKIRTKQIYKLNNGQYIKRSGTLSRSLKNIIKKENNYKSFFKESFSHNTSGVDINTVPYDDRKTILFVEKSVNSTLSIEDKYKTDNKILHTPNEFDTTDKINKVVRSNVYSMFVKENYIDEQQVPYNDSYFIDKSEIEDNKEEIRIRLEFDEPCRLSFNKDSSSSQTITLNNTSYNCSNSPMVYFNFSSKKWDYLGDINKNYFNNITDFSDSPIGFNSIPTAKTNKIDNQSLGYPITTFGFPFDDRFQGLSRHVLNANQYISKPFILEGIKIKFKGTSRAEIGSNFNLQILNSLNFFILNQRKNLNKSSFYNLGLDSGSFDYFTITQVAGSGVYNQNSQNISYSIDNFPIYTDVTKTNTIGESSTLLDNSNSNPNYTDLSSSQRELISYINIVNFSSGGVDESSLNIDIEAIRNNSDFIHEDLTQSSDSNTFANCNYDNKVIEVTSIVKTPVSHNTLESFGKFNVYPSTNFRNRTGTEYKSERSRSSDYSLKNELKTSVDDAGKSLSISKNSNRQNYYMLLPTDELIIGFSFNPNMSVNSGNKSGRDIYIIEDSLDISLIGRYYQKDIPIKSRNVRYKNNSYKRVNYFEQLNLSDSVGTGNAYLNKGGYYDSKAVKSTTLKNKDTFYYFINSTNSSAEIEKQSDVIKPIVISNFKKAFNVNEELLDELLNKKEYSHQYVNGFGFGNAKDRLNYNRFSAFKDLDINRTFNTVLKRFRNSAFQEITSSKSYNDSSNARLNTLSYSYFKE